MDDKRIEDMLRESWSPQPPDGMRNRVLRQVTLQSAKQIKPTILGMSRWQFALVSLAIAIIAMCNVSDHARGVRITKMTGSQSNNTPLLAGKNYAAMRREMRDLLASVHYENIQNNSVKGDESL